MRALDSIAFKLRKPDNNYDTKFKTRIRLSRQGPTLEKRYPDQRNWIKVSVDYLPTVDLQPVPPPTASSSPPTERQRDSKRPRSPQNSPPALRPSKNLRSLKGKQVSNNVSTDNLQDSFVFKNLVDKFATK